MPVYQDIYNNTFALYAVPTVSVAKAQCMLLSEVIAPSWSRNRYAEVVICNRTVWQDKTQPIAQLGLYKFICLDCIDA